MEEKFRFIGSISSWMPIQGLLEFDAFEIVQTGIVVFVICVNGNR